MKYCTVHTTPQIYSLANAIIKYISIQSVCVLLIVSCDQMMFFFISRCVFSLLEIITSRLITRILEKVRSCPHPHPSRKIRIFKSMHLILRKTIIG